MNSVNADTYTNDKTIECKCNTNWLTIEYKLTVNGVEIDCNLSITWLPMECQSTVNWKPIDFQLETHSVRPGLYSTESLSRQAPRSFASIERNTRGADLEMNSVNSDNYTNDKTFECKCNTNWLTIEYQLTVNGATSDWDLSINWLPMECQLTDNWLPIWESFFWDPVSIVQNLSQGRLLGRFPL